MVDSMSELPNESASESPTQAKLPAGWLSEWPWITFLLPMIVFMLATQLEPKPPTRFDSDEIVETILEAEAGFFAENPGARVGCRRLVTATIRTSIRPRSS